MNYYNENDRSAAAWLRQLIADKLIPAGHVDERSILDVNPYELTHYTQHHFFAGIGGWSKALELAGWPVSKRVVTGSCPCQPFSQSGKGEGEKDPRHLWPHFRDLVAHLEAATVFGEQVASPAGREWLARVRLDLENLGYAVGAADLCSAGVGAPHPRQRLFWLAHSDRNGRTAGKRREPLQADEKRGESLAHSPYHVWSRFSRTGTDGRPRRLKPGLEPLAHGVSGRVALIRGAGNAICPQVAAIFIQASGLL